MARIGAQRAVNNFSGGLVTEASQLSFPENSLSEAYNVELGVDGSIQTRGMFSQLVHTTPTFTGLLTSTVSVIKKFYWKERDATIVAYVVPHLLDGSVFRGAVMFCVLGVGQQSKWISVQPPENTVMSSDDMAKYLDVATSPKGFYFVMKYKEGVATRNCVYVVNNPEGAGALSVCNHFSSTTSGAREPATGDFYSNTAPKYQFDVYPDVFLGLACDIWWDGVKVYTGAYTPVVAVGQYEYYITPTPIRGTYEVDEYGGTTVHKLYGVYRVSLSSSVVSSFNAQPISYRDFKGVPNPFGSDATADVNNPPTARGTTISAFYAYNLFNAGWRRYQDDLSVVSNEDATTVSTTHTNLVQATKTIVGLYPSLCDAPYDFTVDQGDSKTIGLYSPFLLKKQFPVTTLARKGSHVLRMSYEWTGNVEVEVLGSYFYPRSFNTGASIPYYDEFFEYAKGVSEEDSSVTCMAIIGGRAWYGVNGRAFNIAYSQVDYVNDNFTSLALGNLTNCYQKNDPNAEIENDILDTDGGTITITEMGTVHKIVEYRNYILIFAENGVWSLSGDESIAFKPTSYTMYKISEDGIRKGDAVLATEDGVFFLTSEDLRVVVVNQSGVIQVSDVSESKIKDLMVQVCREFNYSPNACLVMDRAEKRLYINYNKGMPTSGALPPSDSLYHLAGVSYCLVYDLRLNAFYEWDLSYSGAEWVPMFEGFSLNLNADPTEYLIDIGLSYSSNGGLVSLMQPADWQTTLFFYEFLGLVNKVYAYSRVYGESAIFDGPITRGYRKTESRFEVPFDLVGDMVLNKSVQTMHIYQDADPKFFRLATGATNIFRRPSIQLSWSWDWDNEYSDQQEIAGSIQYPEVVNYTKKKVLINKIKIPGSGRCLSLRFENNTSGDTGGFKLLAYYLDINADSRP